MNNNKTKSQTILYEEFDLNNKLRYSETFSDRAMKIMEEFDKYEYEGTGFIYYFKRKENRDIHVIIFERTSEYSGRKLHEFDLNEENKTVNSALSIAGHPHGSVTISLINK